MLSEPVATIPSRSTWYNELARTLRRAGVGQALRVNAERRFSHNIPRLMGRRGLRVRVNAPQQDAPYIYVTLLETLGP